MKPRALILASVASMIDQFNMQNIQLLLDNGYDVDIITNFSEPGNISAERAESLKNRLREKGVLFYDVGIPRAMSKVKNIVSSYHQVKKICEERRYSIVHCHSPIGGVICRVAALGIRKKGCQVMYTAHGFHFYKGAPFKNWLIFYPIEKICSYMTDVLLTINEEDYELAKSKFKAKKVVRIPGIGVDTNKFTPIEKEDVKDIKRREIGVPEDAIMILSVGELNDNKNQQLIIRAIAEMQDQSVHYVLVGVGVNGDNLKRLANELNLVEKVHFLGYRTDIAELNNCADVFAFPSIREGLGMAALEALACGIPVCGMNTRGINEYVVDGETGYLFDNDANSCKNALKRSFQLKKECVFNCVFMAKRYSYYETQRIMQSVYNGEQ